ncbi:DUF4365 domain-containing protein [Winogradskyella sp.]|uniref:DUF4365 domain-containing protein n=1 Tax=Winogradskyella sp. TaxID=1883156 RepID=UPI001B07CE76|nr:DUF4365 domain-containing protein [Winogradskyella sp.]MBO6880168.1 DUF4365 domain-containing protein [Winogradskyella sp.]
MKLPKYDKNSKKGEAGLTIIKSIVEDELNWIFRKNHQEDDFGIDAYFDIIAEYGQVTGKSIAVQIKTGASYFSEQNDFGWVYRGEMKHLNYYLNHDIPVVIIIVDDKLKKGFWCVCDLEKTEKAGESWKITVPFNQELSKNSKTELLNYISPVTDYVSQLEHFWKTNKMLLKQQRFLLIVGKEDIERTNYTDLISAFSRLEVNPELIRHYRSKVDVSIHGYDYDPRELFEIPEVVTWIKGIFSKIDGWLYFLASDEISGFLKLLFITHAKITNRIPGRIEYETKHSADFLSALFEGLNKFCDKHNISDEINIEQTDKAMNCLTGGEWEKEKK